jgi:hypothetical protein
VGAVATTCSKASSSATSIVSGTAAADSPAEKRVQSRTLSGPGSPEATPSANRSRRSTQREGERRSRGPAQAHVAPIAAAAMMSSLRVRPAMVLECSIEGEHEACPYILRPVNRSRA